MIVGVGDETPEAPCRTTDQSKAAILISYLHNFLLFTFLRWHWCGGGTESGRKRWMVAGVEGVYFFGEWGTVAQTSQGVNYDHDCFHLLFLRVTAV